MIVLAFVVLLTGLVLAYFSRAMSNRTLSDSSFQQARASELAKGALEIIVSDLKQEIIDGSTVSTVGDTSLYLPNSAAAMFPTRNPPSASSNLMPTLLRTSSDTAIASPGVDHAASDVLSTNASANGKVIDISRWNSHYLLPRISGSTSGDTTPISDFVAPKWVYVTDQGPTTLSAPDPAVIGRYAYAVYDEGGLLDVNIAGYPMEPTNVLPASTPRATTDPSKPNRIGYGAKGAIAFADLTALGLSEAAVTGLVGWRNYASAQPSGSFDNFTFDSDSAERYFDAIWESSDGFLSVSDEVWNGRTDQAVLSRQQLIELQKTLEPSGFDADALQYLGTFSRAVTTPSWSPTYNASDFGGTAAFAYKNKADNASSANRDLLGVRHTVDRQLVHYNDDGTSETYSASAGEPLLRTRFSLGKLAWLGHDGPNAAAFDSSLSAGDREDAIQDCFGLEWNNTKKRWDYDHGANGILTLQEVLQEGREADFFELLKAGILDGSLGGHPGEVAGDINFDASSDSEKALYWTGPIGRHYETYSADKDRHILQIGANIIDQADNNNYPTAVFVELFNQPLFSASENEFNNTVFGLENLPMLARMATWAHMTENENGNPNQEGPLAVWLQPEVWNPNNPNTVGTSPADATYPTPSVLRLVTYGKCYVWNTKADPGFEDGPTWSNLPGLDFGNDYTNPDLEGVICFKNPSPNNVNPTPLFDRPRGITGLEAAASADNYYDTTSPSGAKNRYPMGADWLGGSSARRYLGVFLGEVYHEPTNIPDGGSYDGYGVTVFPDFNLSFVLEYYDGSGWRPYSMINRVESFHDAGGGRSSNRGQIGVASVNGHIDPRTDRFSGSAGRVARANNPGWFSNTTVRDNTSTQYQQAGQGGRNPIFQGWPRSSAGFSHDSAIAGTQGYYLFDSWMENLPGTDFFYADPDGVVRPGSGFRADDSTGDGVMTYHADIEPDSKVRRRPVILNRPFRSVAELGYVFRDLPFKDLDFWSERSADAGLLDLFSVRDEPVVVAGQVNPNTAAPEVLRALIANTLKHEGENVTMDGSTADSDAASVAQEIADHLSSNPIANRAGLVDLAEPIQTGFENSSSDPEVQTANKSNKAYAESPLRALASVTNTRTWNLMIDVIAQSGIFPPSATNLDSSFVVQGERRYWLHIAIDRLTGEVVDSQLEPVYE